MRFSINGRPLSLSAPPYIIAELSGNHNGSLEKALYEIDTAQQCGASAVNSRSTRPILMTLAVSEGEFISSNDQSFWKGISLH